MKLQHTMTKITRKTDRWENFLAPQKCNLQIESDLTNKISCRMYLRIKQFLKLVQHLNSPSSSTFRVSSRNLTTPDNQENTQYSLASLHNTSRNSISTTKQRSSRFKMRHLRCISNNNISSSISRNRCRFQPRPSMQLCLFISTHTHNISSMYPTHKCIILTTSCKRQLTNIFHRNMLVSHMLASSPSRSTRNRWRQDYNRMPLPTNNSSNSNNMISQRDCNKNSKCQAQIYPHLHKIVKIASIVKKIG